ncbi:hypothetical protein JG687_00012945 [Phytophthora cactorum]|uniref:Uncharacterized protein n=1 Tax=Phytophthora cactorum TaxID=29920 RepID=A0A329RL70_9STRA|nr:hypothetical protein Pcac1_g25790 [Phytophthora cactorum]KAG2814408.1 hypothetical protein PC111_g13998 [Phytophthora cactorum]KAG2815121.1 hypothetical protein PC112_g14024 [Phytophthora cactorum]KAG2861618.1 hypothetical protein PC113_g7026 [Phytophthora cactorum]KAG2892989.1 hypothetical protein PC114_g16416 [Phytophthora cactorum]
MDGIGGSTTYFVSRHHEHPPATLEELLRVSSKPDSISKKTDSADVIRKRVPDADDADSDSDYQCGSEDSDGDIDSGEPELDEWRLHAAEPREGLYLHEMRRQRGRMDEKEAEWLYPPDEEIPLGQGESVE